jgi:hypothetical protein
MLLFSTVSPHNSFQHFSPHYPCPHSQFNIFCGIFFSFIKIMNKSISLFHDIANTLPNPLPWVVHIAEVPKNSAMMLQNLKRHSWFENSQAYKKIYAIANRIMRGCKFSMVMQSLKCAEQSTRCLSTYQTRREQRGPPATSIFDFSTLHKWIKVHYVTAGVMKTVKSARNCTYFYMEHKHMSHYLNGQNISVLQELQTLIQDTGLLQGLFIK